MKIAVFSVALILSVVVLCASIFIFGEAELAQLGGYPKSAQGLANLGIYLLLLFVAGSGGAFLALKYRAIPALLLGFVGLSLMAIGCFTVYSSIFVIVFGMVFVVLAIFGAGAKRN